MLHSRHCYSDIRGELRENTRTKSRFQCKSGQKRISLHSSGQAVGKLEKLSPFYKQTIPPQCLLTPSKHRPAVYGSKLKKGLFINTTDFRVSPLKSL